MSIEAKKQWIKDNKGILGIELGSTRIKAVLIGEDNMPMAAGAFEWENQLKNGAWSYEIKEAWRGIQEAYKALCVELKQNYDVEIHGLAAIGISAMMHGYLAFDKNGKQIAEFRTWRNTITEQAAAELTEMLNFNIPQRWSVAHLYQAILNNEKDVEDIAFLTTLSGYIHWQLTGEKALGIGDASGMFPIDSTIYDYDNTMLNKLQKQLAEKHSNIKLREILPQVKVAGQRAGKLTEAGAKLIDPSGKLKAGVKMCAPEGDAGTGMTATNSIAERTGNISAGTSLFAMIVLEKALKNVHIEIDMVTTPAGSPVAMVHCNTCTSDIDAWIRLMDETLKLSGKNLSKTELYQLLYNKALEGEADCGGLVAFNYYSGEPITDTKEGRPLFVRKPEAKFNLANFMRCQLYSTLATLKIGMDILFDKEEVKLDSLLGHGGFFKTKTVGQKLMADALNVPIAVMETAAEGGAWGIAILASYMANKGQNQSLSEYLNQEVFNNTKAEIISPSPEDNTGFNKFLDNYKACIAVEKSAAEALK